MKTYRIVAEHRASRSWATGCHLGKAQPSPISRDRWYQRYVLLDDGTALLISPDNTEAVRLRDLWETT